MKFQWGVCIVRKENSIPAGWFNMGRCSREDWGKVELASHLQRESTVFKWLLSQLGYHFFPHPSERNCCFHCIVTNNCKDYGRRGGGLPWRRCDAVAFGVTHGITGWWKTRLEKRVPLSLSFRRGICVKFSIGVAEAAEGEKIFSEGWHTDVYVKGFMRLGVLEIFTHVQSCRSPGKCRRSSCYGVVLKIGRIVGTTNVL